MPLQLSETIYNFLAWLTSEEWIAYYILKSEPPKLKGLKEGVALLAEAGKKPSKEVKTMLKQEQAKWDKFLKSRAK